jgi:hypothetical protein
MGSDSTDDPSHVAPQAPIVFKYTNRQVSPHTPTVRNPASIAFD